MEGSKFPLTTHGLGPLESTRLNANFRLFGNVLCATFSLDEFDIESGTDLAALKNIQSHPLLADFLLRTLNMLLTGDRKAGPLKAIPRFLPAIHIRAVKEGSSLAEADLVALLTGHPEVRPEVQEAVVAKNRSHQVDDTWVLVDRQGVVAFVPFGASTSKVDSNRQRFGNAVQMIEFACAIREELRLGERLPDDILQAIQSPENAIPESVSARNTWKLLVSEFTLLGALNRWKALPPPEPAKRVLIVTVTRTESRAVLTSFAKSTGKPARPVKVCAFMYTHLVLLGEFDVYLSLSEMGTGGLAGSQETIRRSIEDLHPAAVLMVGIAFGKDSTRQAIGDVLVSRQIAIYEPQRLSPDHSVTPRGDKVPVSPSLLNWTRISELTWPSETGGAIRTGLVLSGEKLVDEVGYRNRLLALEPEAIGGEMEGAGLFVAGQTAGVDWILIKGICDWADGHKDENKDAYQEKAAASAAEFTVHTLKCRSEAALVERPRR